MQAPAPAPRTDPTTPTRRSARLLLLMCLTAAAVSAFSLTRRRPAVPPLSAALGREEFESRQRRCLEYRLPPNHLVYVSDPDEAAELTASRRGYAPPRSAVGPGRGDAAHAGAGYYSGVLRGVMFLDTAPEQPVAFVHGRTNAAGEAWLVTLQYDVRPADDALEGSGARVLRFTALSGRPAIWPDKVYVEVDAGLDDDVVHYDLPIPERAPLRLYAAQPDDADPSHFTLRYALGGETGTIDAWLRKGSSVEMKVRDGPAVGALKAVTLRVAVNELLADGPDEPQGLESR